MNELMHYGVKGMKWGVRKDRKLPPRTRRAKAKTKDMTTKDLKRKVERFRLEADYDRYTSRDNTRAKNIVQTLLVGAAGAATGVVIRDLTKKGWDALKGSPVKDTPFIWDLIK